MADALVLQGYRYSVYTRIVRVVLAEKGLQFTYQDVNPFRGTSKPTLHPFGRVPVLLHSDAVIFETSAITRYLDARFDGLSLTPDAALAQARMAQVICLIDAYAYWPMVRQVFAHRVFRPLEEEPVDETEVANGLSASLPVLKALEQLVQMGDGVGGPVFTLADAHLAPILDYFVRAREGRQALADYPNLETWLERVLKRPSLVESDPRLPALAQYPVRNE